MPANWIAFARRDVQAADVLRHNGIYEEACFHAQQAAEKALKAFLLHHGQTPPRIHNLSNLLTRCLTFDTTLDTLRAECTILTQYHAPTRLIRLQPLCLPAYPVRRKRNALWTTSEPS
jgi:HEPN domain-containing protein